jgi:hypothetical protein
MSDDRHRIDLARAVQMVTRAREAKLLPVHGWRFDAPIVREILDQKGAAGIRMYMAVGDDGGPTLVLVGTDEEGNDMAQGTIAENAWPCPPYCDSRTPFGDSE